MQIAVICGGTHPDSVNRIGKTPGYPASRLYSPALQKVQEESSNASSRCPWCSVLTFEAETTQRIGTSGDIYSCIQNPRTTFKDGILLPPAWCNWVSLKANEWAQSSQQFRVYRLNSRWFPERTSNNKNSKKKEAERVVFGWLFVRGNSGPSDEVVELQFLFLNTLLLSYCFVSQVEKSLKLCQQSQSKFWLLGNNILVRPITCNWSCGRNELLL